MYELEARIYFDGAIAVDIADAADQPDGSTELLSIEEASEHTEQESNDSYLGIETELETGTDSSYSSDSIDPIEQLVAGISGDFDFASSYIINQTPETNNPSVLLISSLIENAEEITESASDSTIVIQCKEGMTLNFILEEIRTELDGAEASSIAIVTEDADASFYLTPQNQISENSLSSNADLQNFMQELSSELSNDGTIDIISQDTVDNDIDYQDYLEHLTGKTVSIADTDDIDITSKYFVSSVQNTELNIHSSEVVFINSSVMNAENIIDDLPDNVNIVYLKAGEDGIQEITDYLANKTDIDTMRIISHGNEGYFVLNGEVIDGEYVTNHADLIAEWGDSLSEDGDIMLYGCNLAATTKGQDLVQHIADLTGADVAASTDTTGVSGDWNLEYSIGIIEAGVITDVGYEHNLTNYLVSNTHGSTDIKNSFGWALTEANTSIGADEITFDLSLDSREIIIDNTLNITSA